MAYGITPSGFNRPSFDEIVQDLIQRYENIFGGPINQDPSSAIMQQINIQAEEEDKLWGAMQATNLSQYPDSAEGRSLDGSVQLTGITRRPATKTRVSVNLTGTSNTTIPQGSQASTDDGEVFELLEDVTLDSNGNGSGEMDALNAGPVLVLANELTNIETPVSGWDTVNNPADGETGSQIESDPELRLRREQSLKLGGAGTPEAIIANVLQRVENVTSVQVLENRDDVVVDGRPPHSYETVVTGGDGQDIADVIWQVGPAGPQTYGSEQFIVVDSQDIQHAINFSRPQQIYIWAEVALTKGGNTQFPGETEARTQTKDALTEWGNALGVGTNVLYQRAQTPVYDNVGGINEVVIKLATSTDPNNQPSSGDFQEQNISIADDQTSEWLQDRITVTFTN